MVPVMIVVIVVICAIDINHHLQPSDAAVDHPPVWSVGSC